MKFWFHFLPRHTLRILFYLCVFLTPLAGIWLASSLVAYTNGPAMLAVFSGILLFPLVPILWDMSRKRSRHSGMLTWGDRITLRTLVLNLAFVTLLLACCPQSSFLALSTRGDWFLDSHEGPKVTLAREGLFKVADGLERLYLSFQDNPFEQYADSSQVQNRSAQNHSQFEIGKTNSWPWADIGLHPAIVNMPAGVETSISSVAQYIAAQEKNPLLRVKALHDYAADRIAYDAESYFAGKYPPQDAETVFRTRKAVCAGYAQLLAALGQAIGEEIIYVVGDSRSSTSDLSGQGHAWNAAKVEGKWYLIDATWDSGTVDRATGFTKKYKADFLFPPADVMGITHFPDDSDFQLRSQPISRGKFLRQPMMRPRSFAEGLQLLSPTRSQSDTAETAVIKLGNPNQRWLLASYRLKGATRTERCVDSAQQATQINCSLPAPGTYEVQLYSGDDQFGDFSFIGKVEFNRA